MRRVLLLFRFVQFFAALLPIGPIPVDPPGLVDVLAKLHKLRTRQHIPISFRFVFSREITQRLIADEHIQIHVPRNTGESTLIRVLPHVAGHFRPPLFAISRHPYIGVSVIVQGVLIIAVLPDVHRYVDLARSVLAGHAAQLRLEYLSDGPRPAVLDAPAALAIQHPKQGPVSSRLDGPIKQARVPPRLRLGQAVKKMESVEGYAVGHCPGHVAGIVGALMATYLSSTAGASASQSIMPCHLDTSHIISGHLQSKAQAPRWLVPVSQQSGYYALLRI